MEAEKFNLAELILIPVIASPFKHPPEKTVLWSYTKDNARLYALLKRCCTLENTPVGRYLEKLTEFLRKGNKGPEFTDGQNKCIRSLWDIASERIAKYSSEEVIVILDGDRETPFDLGSTLARAEIVNLKYPKVKRVEVLMVTNSKEPCCTEKHLSELRKALPNISLTCKRFPRVVVQDIISLTVMATVFYIREQVKQLKS